jgi:predicted Rossmann-fold nucleotide-binding protein
MRVEIESTEAFVVHAREVGSIADVVVQGVDLSGAAGVVESLPADGAVFLGCTLTASSLAHVARTGGLVFPRLPDVPWHPYRPALYTVDELMEGYVRGDRSSFEERTLDGRIYAHYDRFRRRGGKVPVLQTLAQRLHDHAIDDAKHDLLGLGREDARNVVGIMGGHALRRDEDAYRDVVRVGRGLSRGGYFVVSGGGPGAMEAAHLGAWLSDADDAALDRALTTLAAAPTYRDDGWFDSAYAVRESVPRGAESLAIPTWFYGHEPTNLFASHVAKYFSNSLREDGLLAIARHGVVFAPGSAGTIQEIFQDAAQNHYTTFGVVSPMVLLSRAYWTRTRPVWPLLTSLADGRGYAELLACLDDPGEVVAFIAAHPPV